MARRSCEAPGADGSGLAGVAGRRTRGLRGAFTSGPVLLAAFAFAIMGDPVSSVAYAMEAGLRSLGGRLALLVPTVIVVLGIIVLVAVNYHYLYARFPEGGGDAAASASAFSEGLAFLPLAALIVDYALTIAISVAAGASAIIAYVPRVAPPVHRVVASAAPAAGHSAVLGVLVAFPVGMALATGVEAPSSAIAQLGQLDNAGRLRFGRTTLWLMVGIVVWLTLGIAAVGVRLHVGLPPRNSTWIAQVAQAAAGRGALFAAFQVTSAVLLLAAASSSFQAGPGLLKALARGGGGVGILPAFLSQSNRHHTPYWGVAAFLAAAAVLVAGTGGQEQRLVLFYAVAVFIAFWCGLAAMTRFFRRDERPWLAGVSVCGVLAVGLTLGTDLARGYPVVSLAAACAIAALLYWMWVRAGRPRGVAQVEQIAEVGLAGKHGTS